MEKNNNNNTVEAPEQVAVADAPKAVEAAPKKRTPRSRKKVVAPVKEEEIKNEETPVADAAVETPIVEKTITEEVPTPETEVKAEEADAESKAESEPEAVAEKKPEAMAESKTEAVTESKPEAMAESKTEAMAENKPEVTVESKPGKPEAKTEKKPGPKAERKTEQRKDKRPEGKPIPKIASNLVIKDFCDLANSGSRIPLLKDDQIQQLTLEDALERHLTMEAILANVLDYDIVLSDTNIWLELLVGHVSSHSDPRVNARLQFERQLEFISKMMKRIGGRFMIMSETYEEIDRFAAIQEPTNYKDADWSDEVLCRNVAARLAKRLILSQQKENRLRIVGICSECHHGAFADPAIIRYTVELFAQGKKVLLLTNDASVGIRSLGMCDDLQRINNIDDTTWRTVYEPQRPMVLTMDDLKLLDSYTRQYYYLMLAAGCQWMQNVNPRESVTLEKPLDLWLDGFRPGDRHERRSDRIDQQRREEREKAERERAEQQRREREEQRKAKQQKQREAKKTAQQPAQMQQPVQTQQPPQVQQPVQTQQPQVQQPVQTQQPQVQQPVQTQQQAQPAQETPAQPVADTAADAQKPANAPKQDNSKDSGKAKAKEEKTAAKEYQPSPDSAPMPMNEAQVNAEEVSKADAEPTAPVEETPLGFGATAEMMDLIGPQPGEKKSRTRRSSRRRPSGNRKKPQANMD